MDLLKSSVAPYHGSTLAVISKDMQSLNLRVMWSNLLRVVCRDNSLFYYWYRASEEHLGYLEYPLHQESPRLMYSNSLSF